MLNKNKTQKQPLGKQPLNKQPLQANQPLGGNREPITHKTFNQPSKGNPYKGGNKDSNQKGW